MNKIDITNMKRKASVVGMMVAGLVGAGVAYGGAPAAVVKAGAPGAGSTIADGAVALVWSGDAVALPIPVQLGRDKDFLAVIDNEPYSSTYGKVIWTAELTSLMVGGGVPGGVIDGSAHNDPHHILSYESYVDAATRHKFAFAGGVISKNIFRFDITSVRNIPIADPVVCGTQPTQSSLTDDFFVMPNGNIMVTYMSNFGYSGNELGAGTPSGGGTVSEFNPMRTAKTLINLAGIKVCLPGPLGGSSEDINSGRDTYLGEYQVSPDTGASANVSRRAPLHADNSAVRADGANKGLFFFGNTNASKEGLPHGMGLSYDGKYLIAADYAVAVSIGAAAANVINNVPGVTTQVSQDLTFSTFGAAVRVMNVNPATLDPVPAYGPKNAQGYSFPTTNTYNQQGQYALDGKPTDDPGAYMHSISVVPDGPRHEQVAFHEEPEGLMPFSMFHQSYHCPHQKGWDAGADGVFGTADDGMGGDNCPASQRIEHDGASVDSMCGGSMFYTANVRLPQSANNGYGPIWHAIYDVGPCAGVSYHAIFDDDRLVAQPIAGIESNTNQDVLVPPVFDRDYPREHSRRILTMDFRPLLAKGNGISNDANGDGEINEDDLAFGATFTDPVNCGFTGEATRVRKGGVVEVNGAVGRGMTNPGDGGPAITPAAYVATTGTPYAASYNILIHNNRADDCPRVLGAIGQFETGTNASEPAPGIPVGLPTTQTGNNGQFPGVGYAQYATLLTDFHSDTEVGGAPTLTNINTAQNMNTNGGPHFTHQDRIGFCLPTGSANGLATCKPGSYYDLSPDLVSGSPRQIYPATSSDVVACAAGSTAYKGSNGSTANIDPSCVQRLIFIQYFVELNHVPAPGTGSDGDRTICEMLVNRVTGATMMDPQFVDELTKQPCLDFDSRARERTTFGLLGADTCGSGGNSTAGNYCWPGARGGKGGAKPHSIDFERDGAAMFGPGYFPLAPSNPDGNI
jgi:hypothetical protein